jgi:hypothetical protein
MKKGNGPILIFSTHRTKENIGYMKCRFNLKGNISDLKNVIKPRATLPRQG